jgi:phosphoglycolate phosphatase
MKAVIFDFDGTIADTRAMLKELNEEASREFGLKMLSQAEIDEMRKKSLSQIVRHLKIPAKVIPKLIVRVPQMMHQRISKLKPYKDMPKVLNQLHKTDGLVIALLSSNSRANIYTFLNNNDLQDKFNFIETKVALFSKHTKLRQLMRKHRLNTQDCIYVGDEIRDVEAAHKVPMPVIAVSWGINHPDLLKMHNPDQLVNQPKQILKIIEHWLKTGTINS